MAENKNNIRFGYTFKPHGNEQHSLRIRLSFVCDELDRLHQRQAEIQAQMEQLAQLGMTDARPYWMRKDDPGGKPDQLELTHRINSEYYEQHNTRREYIGVKPDKIKAALARVQRYKEHARLKQEHRQISQKIKAIERQIKNLEYVTQSKQGHLYW